MKRRISHGQAIRSTAAFLRVTKRIGSVAPRAFPATVFLQVLRDVPGPQLHDVPARVGDIRRSTASVAVSGVVVVQHLESHLTQAGDPGGVVPGGEGARVGGGGAPAAAPQTALRGPAAPPPPVPGPP